MPASAEPVHKGTLVCVVLKARNLPNKKSIGKQDPYTVLTMGQESQKTKPDKRGGQHPTWDEQLHFEVYEDMEDALIKDAANGSGSMTTSATSAAATKTKGGKKVLKVACYADDSKEPDFIGEGLVDLTETLKTGEFDEWVTIKAKDRYAGEVYLELTFYSAAAPPKKRRPSTQPTVLSGTETYGGAGSFSRIEDGRDAASSGTGLAAPPKPPKGKGDHPPIPASMRPGSFSAASTNHHRMSSSISASGLASMHRSPSAISHSQTMHDLGSSTLRPSSSLANMDAYTPAYAPASISRAISPAPPSSAHHLAAHAYSPSVGPTAGGSRRNSYAAPMPSEFGHSITPSASYYSHQSITPSQSSQYIAHQPPLDPSDDMYATVKPADFLQQQQQQHHHQQQQQHPQQYSVPRSQSISHIPIAYNQVPQPDFGAEQLAQSMSKMGFSHSTAGTMDRPPPPRTPAPAEERPPQSHIYQAPAHLASLYQPPPNAGHSQDVQRPVSPAARPTSALSQYSSHSAHQVSSAPSVVNAQAYYQQAQTGGHLAQPASVPPRASSPGAPGGYHPIPSPYSQPTQQAHASRPLPSTHSSSALSSAAPPQHQQHQQQQHVYPSHLYQGVQQPSAPPSHHPQQLSHSHSQSFSHNTWHGPPPQASQPAQPSYAPALHPAANGSIPTSASSGYLYSPAPPQSSASDAGSRGLGRSPSPLPPIPGSQQHQPSHMPSFGSIHGFYGASPAPAPAPATQSYGQSQQYQQQYTPPPQQQHESHGRRLSMDPSGYNPHAVAPQHHYATVSAGTQPHGQIPSSFSSSALYQSHQKYQQHYQ